MEKSPFLKQKRERITRFFGGRAVILFETELPVGESAAAVHFEKMAAALLQYADERIFPEAVKELETLSAHARGYDFFPYKLFFAAKPHRESGRFRVRAEWRQVRGRTCLHSEHLDTFWSEDASLQLFPCTRIRHKRKNNT